MSAILSEIGERGFIEAVRNAFPMALAGDDGAVLESMAVPVVTTDSFFEGTHFHRWWTTPERTAERILEASLSDLAAMGAQPRHVFSSVVLPPDMELDWIMAFYRGLTSRGDCPVAGGETVRGSCFGITLTAIGECGDRTPFRRSSARPGDTLWITGPLGRAYDAPRLLEEGRTRKLTVAEEGQTVLFLDPRARFDAVPLLRDAGAVAAIDVSDGLFSECMHIAGESSVGVRLDLDAVPLVEYCSGMPLEACSAGEDFELLFTLPQGASTEVFQMIGRIEEGSSLEVFSRGKRMDVPVAGYDHFT